MALKKITDAEMDAAGVCAAPDVLSGTPAENKKVFDRMVRQLVAPAYNAAVDAIGEIEDTEAGIEAEEAAREQAEATRKENESQRQTNEQARQTAETGRGTAEGARAAAETQRQTDEQGRQTAESGRISAENERVRAEAARGTAEGTREDHETVRQAGETARETAETARGTAEGARVTAENQRAANETQRQENEAARQTAEQARNVFEDYAADKAYVPGNKVAWQGSSYVCTAACTGIAPPDAARWLLMAKKGTDGATMPASGLYGFDVDPDSGQLRLYYTGDTQPDFTIDADGHLIYKLSPDVSVDIGVVKGADGDTTLGITGASVGQVARVQEVDSDGRPIKWEAASVSAGVGEICDESSGISARYPEKMTIQVAQASRWGRLVQVVLQIIVSEDIPVNYGWIATLPRIANTRAWFSSTLGNNVFFVNGETNRISCNTDVFPAGANMLFGTYLTNENVEEVTV